ARARDRALPSTGDRDGMGHRHTSEEQRGAGGVRGAGGGFAADASRSVMSASKSDFGAVPARSKDVRSFLQGLKRREWRHISWGLKYPPAKAQRSIAMSFALFALRFYKVYLSALVDGTCRFEPTCSLYAYEAIERF